MFRSYRFFVSGKVQGVGFRQATCKAASELRVLGWVRNRADGRVEGVAEGGEEELMQFQRWLNQGPPTAMVSSVTWQPAEPIDSQLTNPGFIIRPTLID